MTANFGIRQESGTNLERINAMLKPITREQSHAIATTLVANIDWNQLDGCGDLLQENVITAAKIAGFHVTDFLKAGARMSLGDLKIATAPFSVKEFVGSAWELITDEQDERSAALTKVDLAKGNFFHCLTDAEVREGRVITGEEKLKRLKNCGRIRYGTTVFMGLWLDYEVRGKESVLERLHQEKGVTYVDFFGDILLDPSHDRCVPCLYRFVDGTWRWDCYWLDGGWRASHVSLVSGQV